MLLSSPPASRVSLTFLLPHPSNCSSLLWTSHFSGSRSLAASLPLARPPANLPFSLHIVPFTTDNPNLTSPSFSSATLPVQLSLLLPDSIPVHCCLTCPTVLPFLPHCLSNQPLPGVSDSSLPQLLPDVRLYLFNLLTVCLALCHPSLSLTHTYNTFLFLPAFSLSHLRYPPLLLPASTPCLFSPSSPCFALSPVYSFALFPQTTYLLNNSTS